MKSGTTGAPKKDFFIYKNKKKIKNNKLIFTKLIRILFMCRIHNDTDMVT